MDYKPSDVFIGVIDLFAIFIPGALATYLLRDTLLEQAKTLKLTGLDTSPVSWVAFFVGACVFGHLLFLMGSFLDFAYDPLRRWIKPLKKDLLYQEARSIRNQLLAEKADIVNPYKFAKAVLGLESAHPIEEIARLEADSKFFRSLFVVLGVFLIIHMGSLRPALGCLWSLSWFFAFGVTERGAGKARSWPTSICLHTC
jgi:hypothetical protein